jgi:UDP-glucuronate 4-epimerase
MSILVTGVAGFIGSTLALRLLEQGNTVIGIDNLSDYYDVELKRNRLARCKQFTSFQFLPWDIVDRKAMAQLFAKNKFEVVVHLAAQPGVRYSVENPHIYIDVNLVGFANILEECRQSKIQHFVYASSSSVYGANTKLPFSEHDAVDHPISLYGATKRANELMAHSYAHLYGLPCTGLRFFTVYGPWCRPDMALYKFTNSIMADQPIQVYNNGKMMRDFTYIDDIVVGVMRVMDYIPQPQLEMADPSASAAPYRIYNIGNQYPVELTYYIQILESCLGKKAQIQWLPMQGGDVLSTYADVSDLEQAVGVLPHTSVEKGIANFVEWYLSYYSLPLAHLRRTVASI